MEAAARARDLSPVPTLFPAQGSGGSTAPILATTPDTAGREARAIVRPCPYTDIREKSREGPAEDAPRDPEAGSSDGPARTVFLAPSAELTPSPSAGELFGSTKRRIRTANRPPRADRSAKRSPGARLAKATVALRAAIETAEDIKKDGRVPALLERALAEVARLQALVHEYHIVYDRHLASEAQRSADPTGGRYAPAAETITEGDEEAISSESDPAQDTAGEPSVAGPLSGAPTLPAQVARDTDDAAAAPAADSVEESLPGSPSPITEADWGGTNASVPASAAELVVPGDAPVVKLDDDDSPDAEALPQYQ